MTQVAGLQTVDAEGNVIGTLSVDDLTELVANNLVKSTQNQIAAARSVSTMSEASTLAASDDYENTLPIDANPASVRTLDAAGNPKQTGISAFAQVVGGLLASKGDLNASLLPKGMYFNKYFEGFSGKSILLIELNRSGSNSLRLSFGYPLNRELVDVFILTKTGGDSGKPHALYVKRVIGVTSQLESAIAYYDKSKDKVIIEMTLTQNLYSDVTVFCYSSNCNDIKCVQTSEYDSNNDTNLVNAVIS